jgi:hypothetical protein
MRKRPRLRALLIPLLAAGFVLAGQLPASASLQPGSDAAIYPLAVCRDGIRFLFFADWYPAGSDEPAGEEAPYRVQPVQAASPVPPIVDGRAIAPADTLVLDVTLNVPYAPRAIDFDHFYQAPVFPKYPPNVIPSGPYPQTTGVQIAEYTGDYTLRWDRKLKAGPQAVVLSFNRFDPASHSIEFIADVDNCHLFNGNHPRDLG